MDGPRSQHQRQPGREAHLRNESLERSYTRPAKANFSLPRQPSLAQISPSNSSSTLAVSAAASGSTAASSASEWPAYKYGHLQARNPKTESTDHSVISDPRVTWKPLYLQRRILCVFALAFAGLIVAVEGLLSLSNQGSGFTVRNPGLHYIWTFAPPLILTGAAALWSRVECQVKSNAPWVRLAKGSADAKKTILLDYLSMFRCSSVLASIANRDYGVAAATSISLLLKGLIIVSTALFTTPLSDTQNASATILGTNSSVRTVISTGNRLLVNELAAQLMAGLLGLSFIFTTLLIVLVPGKGFIPRSASTIIGVAALLRNGQAAIQPLRALGAADKTTIQSALGETEYRAEVEGIEKVETPNYCIISNATVQSEPAQIREDPIALTAYPMALHPASRLIFCAVLTAMISALESALQLSNRYGGLGNVQDDTYMHFLWTIIPAAVYTLVSVYTCAADFAARSMAPYINLERGADFDATVGLNMADKSIPGVLLSCIRTRNVPVTLSVFAALISSMLPVISSTLFQVSLTSTSAQPRLVQDAVSTRVLEGILGGALVLTASSWALMPKTNILPRSPSSIASAAALLADSNIFAFLPRGAEWMSDGELRKSFADAEGFKLGWTPVRGRRPDVARGQERYMIRALRLGGWRGGEEAGLGLRARVGKAHWRYVKELER